MCVRDVLKDVLLPWYNAYRFFIQNVLRLQKVWAVVLWVGLYLPSLVELDLPGPVGESSESLGRQWRKVSGILAGLGARDWD